MSFNYTINGENNQVLQVVIEPGESISADCHAVCWASENLKYRREDSIFAIFAFSYRTDAVVITNCSTTTAFAGLCQQNNGPISVLDFRNSVCQGIYCFKEYFICASPNVKIEIVKLPLQCKLSCLYEAYV